MTENTSTQAMPLLTVCASEPGTVPTAGRAALGVAGARVHAQRCLQTVLLPMPQCCDAFFIYERQAWLLQAEW